MKKNFAICSPIDGSVVWTGRQTSGKEIQQVMQRAAAAQQAWGAQDQAKRDEVARRYAAYLGEHRQEITDLVCREVGKLPWDAAAEVDAAINKVELSIAALQERRREQREGAGSIMRAVRYQPLGVTLVLGPFNFPLHLPGGQIMPALLAGNSVVFKPSEQATAVGQWMVRAWHQSGLPADVMQVIVGGVETAVAAIDAPEISAVFLTGSQSAGRAIHRQLAGRTEVLLALELGGNNPVVIAPDVVATWAAEILSFSAFVSAGQRCTCARRAIYVVGDETERQIEALLQCTQSLRVGLPSDSGVQVGPLISAQAATHLHKTYQELIQLGCQPLLPWRVAPHRSNLVHPVILDASEVSSQSFSTIGKMEWFGPVLVIRRATDLDAATAMAADTSYGLAASLLGGDRLMFESFVRQVRAGVVNWNGPTTGAAGNLPFGGLKGSGNQRPAGYFAIDFCNEPVASLERPLPEAANPWSIAK